MLDKFQSTSFVLSAWDKIRRLVERNICLTKKKKYQTQDWTTCAEYIGKCREESLH